ncbi:MAG: LCP family protein [Patescibacteria group bacterium]|nr:LCP family protein [Patescibacteria group bacterium]
MGIFSRRNKEGNFEPRRKKFYKKRWFKILAVILLLLIATGGWAMYKAGTTLSKISTKDGFFKSLWKSIPGVGPDQLQGEEEGQVNVLLLGMRGNNMPGGGLLADTIMVVMARPKENKLALLSVPRDLWVKHPDSSTQSKINSIHALYEEKGEGKGMDAMKQVIGEITGIPIHYAVRIDFIGFKELVDTVGGVDVYLDKPFSEPKQFEGENALDFSLPAGKNHIDGQKALFFVRARYASSDFERARRQQQVLLALKDKMLSLGTLTDFGKVNNILNVLGEDVRTDMDISEMKKFFELANKSQNLQIKQKVLDTSEEGLLNSTKADTPEGKTYVLLPARGNYDKIRELVKNIFN